MKIILLALFSLALISIGLVEQSFAFWPFDTPQPDPNKVTIRQADSVITYDKKTNLGSWQSAPKWILNYNDYQGNPVYSPYKIWDSSNYVTFENAQSSVTVEKNTCSLRIFDGGRVIENQTALLNSVYFDLQYAKNGTDIWNESPENFQSCNVGFTNSTNGLTANLIQGTQTEKNIELRLYDNSIPELILKVKNNDYSNVDTKYGFAVIISNSSNVSIDGDLIKFQDRNGKSILLFDTQNSINHYLWTVKKVNDGLILDYKNAKGPLPPGNTLEIDPTFSQTASTFPVETSSGSDNAACTNTAVVPTTGDESRGFSSASGFGCSAVIQKYDITSFPKTVVISSIQTKQDIIATSLTGNFNGSCTIRQVIKDPSGMTNQQKLTNITSNTEYLHSSWCGTTGTNTKVNLGNTAITDFKNQLSGGFFSFGIQKQTWTQSNSGAGSTGAVFSNPTLLVNYTLPVPNAVTNVSCSPTQALGNTCTWNNATSTGGKVRGFYVTRNGTNEPLYSLTLLRYFKFDGLTLSNTIEDYSLNKLNGTISSGSFNNKTGMIANSINFTGSQSISGSSTGLPSGNNAFTISMWINPKSVSTQQLVSFWGTESVGNAMIVAIDESTSGRIDIDSFGGSFLNSNTLISANVWSNIVVTSDGTKTKIYINGVLDTNSISHTWNIIPSSLRLSGYSGGQQYTGLMDDYRIYNKALSQSEITTLYNYRLNSPLSKLDTYILKDGKTYNYCIYPVNQYGQNDTGTCNTTVAKNYAPPPNQLNGKFYKDGSNHYNVQINWSKPSQFLGDNFLATGYKLQKLVGSTWSTVLSNTTATSYTDSSLQNTTTQKYRVFSNNHLGTSPGYIFENTNNTGLKTLYQFENNTLDSRGTNTITMTRDDNYTSGFIGYALALNGTQYGKSSATGVPNGTSDRTISLWIKPSSFSTNSNSYLGTGTSSANSEFAIIDANGKIDCGGAGNNVNTTTTLTANHWALITCVLSNTGQTRSIYINGTLDKTSTTTAINSASTSLYIGTRPDNTNRNVTSLIDNVRVYNTALNSTYVSELYNQAITSKDNAAIAGTHTISFTTVGDVTRATSTLTITTGFPPPTITNWHLYNYSTVYNNTNVSTPIVSNTPETFLYGNYFNVDILHNFKAVAVVSNGTSTTLINSTTYPILYNYLPTYTTTGGVMWNYTLTRPAPATNISLLANQNPILFTMHCQIQTASDAAAGTNNGWYNQSNVGYFLQSITVHNYDNMYGTCWTPGNVKLFTFVSYGNSSLFPAINFMNTSYGAYIGVPVGVVFIVMAAALGNRRTAPMWVVIILAMAGIMATVGFFTLNAGVWALALIAGLLALFVGKKLF